MAHFLAVPAARRLCSVHRGMNIEGEIVSKKAGYFGVWADLLLLEEAVFELWERAHYLESHFP